jgi:GAF domain-containing protein
MTDERPLSAIPDESSRLELLESQLATLCEVSSVLSRSLNLRETLQEVLRVLHERGRLSHGLVALLDEESGDLLTCALHQGQCGPPGAGPLWRWRGDHWPHSGTQRDLDIAKSRG